MMQESILCLTHVSIEDAFSIKWREEIKKRGRRAISLDLPMVMGVCQVFEKVKLYSSV